MILPILISVSVAPVSYFFWARAPVLVVASITIVTDNTAGRYWKADMKDLLGLLSVASLLSWLGRQLLNEAIAASDCLPITSGTPGKLPSDGSQLIYRSLRRWSATNHLGFMSIRPAQFLSSSSHNITPIVIIRIFSVCFWVDGRVQA